MDKNTHINAFDALVDRGVDPGAINAEAIQHESQNMDSSTAAQDEDAVPVILTAEEEAWRAEKLGELFSHVEIMVDRLRHLAASGALDDSNRETYETIQRLNLSAKSIHHLSVPADAATLYRFHQPDPTCAS